MDLKNNSFSLPVKFSSLSVPWSGANKITFIASATKVITIYAEDIGNPTRFVEMAKKANAKQKPVIIIKTGRSVRGAIATHSHTGALSTSDTAYDSLFAQCGVIRVETLAQLFECAKGFTCMAKPKGNRIVIVTNGGGLGIIATDAAERNGLEMTTFEPHTLKALKKILPPSASIHNPVDIIGDADAQRLNHALSLIATDKNVDAIIVSITPTADFPETVIRVLASMVKYFEWINQPQVKITNFKVNKRLANNILNKIKKERRIHLSEPDTYQILRAYGMKAVDYRNFAHQQKHKPTSLIAQIINCLLL